ncbi:S46 family peptidase [Thermomonas brevis]
MRHRRSFIAIALVLAAGAAHADEGMWMPSQLPQLAKPLRAAGFKGDPNGLADLTRKPMAAVVSLGGCTASFVSPQGLVVTNHHCAMGAIQLNSTAERNLIQDGFIAANPAGEVSAGPSARVFVTVGFDEVTERVLAGARGKQGRDYFDAVDAAQKALVAGCEADAGHRCGVATMYYGRAFYLIKQLELKDIRLVYAPPRAIGNYGDEIDNFMWPRHTGDFTFYRAYVGRDGKPAAFSPDNVPYQPPAWLTVSTAPVKAGDFAMVAGYPGTTFRHRTASEFAQQMQWQLPSRVALFDGMIRTIDRAAAGDADAQVKYAATQQRFKNNLKRAQGEAEGLRRSDAASARRADEQAMLAWLQRQPDGAGLRAGIDALQAILDAESATRERNQLLAALRDNTEALRSAIRIQRLALERGKPDAQRQAGYQDRDLAQIEAQTRQVTRRYAPAVEKALVAHLLAQYYALPADQRVAEVDAVFGAGADGLPARLDALYAGTKLGEESERMAALQADAATLAASRDTLLQAAAALQPAWLRQDEAARQRDGELLRLRPAYMQALTGFRQSQGKAVYPDANSTLRVSFGKVSPLAPRDAVDYRPVTTVAGIVEKNTGVEPFDAPKPLLEAIAKGDFGSTADPTLKTQTVNFMTNLDTTGGNSGSPVLDAHGRLIGLNFDSNWEAVSASWMFDPRYKRAIHVDMRYLRWILSKVYPAPWLLKEMNLPVE